MGLRYMKLNYYFVKNNHECYITLDISTSCNFNKTVLEQISYEYENTALKKSTGPNI
jgi:hypothetical protein